MAANSTVFHAFWKRWSMEYLTIARIELSGLRDKSILNINDLILLKDLKNLPPLKWRLGRIIELIDGKVRVAKLKTLLGELKRPVHKRSLLPLSNWM
ncbi:hypothetical protein CEXT_598731 [Caerostris extrusa]|uniref:DUF5641 domain-containing protein n=1 Tax=Caerostris extrusa TaxID=172846 RepID=A0AAV4US55_CAEEX|nr:hypothetical protein CEXT_598731 [Caerostris extrusa]